MRACGISHAGASNFAPRCFQCPVGRLERIDRFDCCALLCVVDRYRVLWAVAGRQPCRGDGPRELQEVPSGKRERQIQFLQESVRVGPDRERKLMKQTCILCVVSDARAWFAIRWVGKPYTCKFARCPAPRLQGTVVQRTPSVIRGSLDALIQTVLIQRN